MRRIPLWLFVLVSVVTVGALIVSLVRMAYHQGVFDMKVEVEKDADLIREFLDSHVHIPKK